MLLESTVVFQQDIETYSSTSKEAALAIKTLSFERAHAGTFRLHHLFCPDPYNVNPCWCTPERQRTHRAVAVPFRVDPGYAVDIQMPECDCALRHAPIPTYYICASQKNRCDV